MMSCGLVEIWLRKILLPASEGHRIERRYTPEDGIPPYEQIVLTPNLAVFN